MRIKSITKYVLILTLLVVFSSLVSSANYYVIDPNSCPSSDGTNFPGQNCAPDNICGDDSGTAQCYDTSTLTAPSGNTTTSGSGGTNYGCSDSTCNGGFIVNCYASVDAASPFCDNNGNYLVDRNSTCYNKHVQTVALGTDSGGGFGQSVCSSSCTTNYFQCDGSTIDTDGCEINAGSSCGSSTGNVVNNQCFSVSAGNCTNYATGDLDCNDDDGDGNTATCNGGGGSPDYCEVNPGSSCTIAGLPGTVANQCPETCVVDDQDIATTGNAVEWSGTNPMLWLVQYGAGLILNFTGQNNNSLTLDTNANLNTDGNVTADTGFLNLAWSYLTSVPNLIYGLWTGNNNNNLLVSNGTAVGYNETVFNNSAVNVGLAAGFNSTYNSTYANIPNQQCPVGQVVNGTFVNGTFTCVTSSGSGIQNNDNATLDELNITGSIDLQNNATITRSDTNTAIWIDEGGNINVRLG